MAYLLILGTGERCALNESQIGIGRAPDNEVAVPDKAVSIYHAMVTVQPSEQDQNVEECIVEDLGSTNKTFVNNKEISRYVLKNGDIIRVGNTRLKFSEGKYEPPPPDLKQTQKLKKTKTSDYLYTRKN
ncbi:MAG: FHA domain-containing protein [Gammaproteobacteria bacterium]